HVRVVLERLRDRAVGLPQGALRCTREVGQRATERLDEEGVGLRVQREGTRLATGADHSARARREGAQALALAARRARREPGCEPRRHEQLQAEGQGLSAGGGLRAAVEQLELVAE